MGDDMVYWHPAVKWLSGLITASFAVLALFFIFWAIPLANRVRDITGYGSAAEAKGALQRDPNDARAHRTLADDAVLHSDHETAVREWREASRLEPGNYNDQLQLGFNLVAAKRRGEAKQFSPSLRRRAPRKPDTPERCWRS